MSQKSFLGNKKSRKNFPYVGRGGGGNQHMENSICFVVFIFESFPKLLSNVNRQDADVEWQTDQLDKCMFASLTGDQERGRRDADK